MVKLSILFLCTGNSCRSQMAEGWARELLRHSKLAEHCQINISSAGVEAHGLNPMAIEAMAAVGLDIQTQTSEVLVPEQLPEFDWVITLCDHAQQQCPLIPGKVKQQHWSLPDPAVTTENTKPSLRRFCQIRDEIRSAITDFIAALEQPLLSGAQPPFVNTDIEILERETKYQGFFDIQQLQIQHKLFAGGGTGPFTRELFVRGQAVVVLLYDAPQDQLVLIEQFRIGALQDKRSPWLVELVAGIVEPGESPEAVAHREAEEEAGCEIQELIKLYDYWVSPGGSNESVVIFCGRVDSTNIGGIHGLPHEHEDIRVKVVAFEWAIAALGNGIINNAATIMALQWLQLNKAQLRQQWI